VSTAAEIMRERHGPYGKDIREPSAWDDDGGKRVEVIVDPNWLVDGEPRVIRRMAWRSCLAKPSCRFLSSDVARVRICDYHKSLRSYEE
jgi:hypothetical protein